jgi:hypothetical protein
MMVLRSKEDSVATGSTEGGKGIAAVLQVGLLDGW